MSDDWSSVNTAQTDRRTYRQTDDVQIVWCVVLTDSPSSVSQSAPNPRISCDHGRSLV